MEKESQQNCLIFDENPANFNILKRMVQSFHLNPVKFEQLDGAVKYLEHHQANLVIIDTDWVKNSSPAEVTTRLKKLNPNCVVVWVCAHRPGQVQDENEEAKPDIILEKPFGMMLFQQVMTPYIFSQSIPGYDNSTN